MMVPIFTAQFGRFTNMTNRMKLKRALNKAGLIHVKAWVSQEDAPKVEAMAEKVAHVVRQYDEGEK
jgi:hypothetical protein